VRLAFIGGGNMANALIGGLLGRGLKPGAISVVEPEAAARRKLAPPPRIRCSSR
jgi:pyrroline-5-carboxylate reductase